MPYYLDGNCVKKDDGTTVKCHDNHADALAHMRALQMNVDEAKEGKVLSGKNASRIRQALASLMETLSEVGMDMGSMGDMQDKAAKNPDMFAYVPDEESPSTWKLDISDAEHVAGAITALQRGGFRGQKVEIPADDKKKVISKISARIGKLPISDDEKGHLRERLSAVKSIEKQANVPTQAEVNYIPLSTTKGQACANCRWLVGDDACYLIQNGPENILPTGWCDRWEAKPEPPPALEEVVTEVVEALAETVGENIADMGGMMIETMQSYPKEQKPNLLQRAKNALFGSDNSSADDAFSVFKGTDGKFYWIARHTNAYEDRDHEILAEKAHEDYIRRLDMKLVPMPELWAWHMKGSRHGQADTVFGIGKIVVSIGHFDDTPEAQKALGYYRKNAKNIKLSHGFTAPIWAFKDGVYSVYNTFEISTLPDGAESNPFTSFEQVKAMQPNPEKIKFAETLFGKDKAAQIVADTEKIDKSVSELGVKYKDFADVGDTPADKPTDNEQIASFAKAYEGLLDTQKATFDLLEKLDKKLSAQDATIAAQNKQIAAALDAEKELRALVNAGPRRMIEADETKLTPEEAEKLKKEFQGIDLEASKRWGVPVLENPKW